MSTRRSRETRREHRVPLNGSRNQRLQNERPKKWAGNTWRTNKQRSAEIPPRLRRKAQRQTDRQCKYEDYRLYYDIPTDKRHVSLSSEID
ncbi:hypothetical protein DPMN_026406 [Dreissena polymorpha]|uniref:Uncharacterized protein n=1 Tax=Dreissena polymorpha TaxID=45954 RepID=A0A9D4LTC1_DREPO|nr:hypothetical protein DPMN_026406 [Dreissena polymorpha]